MRPTRELAKSSQRLCPETREARLASPQNSDYKSVLSSVYNRRRCFADAQPVSAMVLGYGSSFLYRQGFLSYVCGDTIRVLNVHAAAVQESVIRLDWLSNRVFDVRTRNPVIQLNHFQSSVLSFTFGRGQMTRYIVCVDVRDNDVADRLLRVTPFPHSKFIIRNDSEFVYVGSHDGLSTTGQHREWIWQGFRFRDDGTALPQLQIPDLAGTDLGQTVLFEIFDDYFYAISNESTFEDDEMDWCSYYHCYRFPVHDPRPKSLHKIKIWRRQHKEGPINDSWTDLKLHKDENTGALVIVEGRREWSDGKPIQKRTFYHQVVPASFDEQGLQDHDEEQESPEHDDQNQSQNVTYNPAPTTGLSTSNEVDPPYLHYMIRDGSQGDVSHCENERRHDQKPRHHRLFRNTHPEYSERPPPPFVDNVMLAKSKFRTYNLNASAFFDLIIEDPPHSLRVHQICLRIGSRVRASPLDERGLIHEHEIDQATRKRVDGSEERFTDQGIKIWPPANAPVALLNMLNSGPPSYGERTRPGYAQLGEISALADERSVVYLARPSDPAAAVGKVVLVNFDRNVRYRCKGWRPRALKLERGGWRGRIVEMAEEVAIEGMRKKPPPASAPPMVDGMETKEVVDPCQDQTGEMKDKGGDSGSEISTENVEMDADGYADGDDEKNYWLSTKKAMWTQIREGYRFV
ncbi:MAG: hypothetical protein LQ342_002057 [Letrouitia transgressa]|nr:MAG: hypothetical protein LQ342_002057 [Letrouitia transgressa]